MFKMLLLTINTCRINIDEPIRLKESKRLIWKLDDFYQVHSNIGIIKTFNN